MPSLPESLTERPGQSVPWAGQGQGAEQIPCKAGGSGYTPAVT